MWLLRMAWRETRGAKARLLLFVSSIVLGVAALVAIQSFGDSLRTAIDGQARALLGADMSIEDREPFGRDVEAIIDSLGGDQARRVSFSSMAYFPASRSTRLSTVRAVDGDFPFYGELLTEPENAAETYQRDGAALVDGSLASQFSVQTGDTVTVGGVSYPIAGILKRSPRESAAFSLVSPRVYVPLSKIDTTLIGVGSRVTYEVFFRFDEAVDADAVLASIKPRLRELRVGSDSVGEIKENWNEALANLYRFLGLAALMALLLGSVGVASAIHVYVSQRLQTVAVLRCLGARVRTTFGVYVTQAVGLGVIGSVAGAILGVAVQQLIPVVLSDFLPVDVEFAVSLSSILYGVAVGTAVTVLFSLLPLLRVRRVSPMMALRSAAGLAEGRGIDWIRIAALILVVLGVLGIAVAQGPNPLVAIIYVIVMVVVCGLLIAMAWATRKAVHRLTPASFPYVWRQGLANLHRPNNQTLMMMLAVGLGTFLVSMFISTERTLLRQIEVADEMGRPNLIFFDIQPDQADGVAGILEERGLPVVERVPIVTMRRSAVNGVTVEEMRADTTRRTGWAFRREYRSTYRSYMTVSETLVEGEFATGRYSIDEVVPISVEEEIMGDLNVSLGDTLIFDVQGVPVSSYISSVRRVEWRQVRTNFFVVFPGGVLEEAPHFNVIVTRAETDAASGGAQAAVVRSYPNVSSIDLSLILKVFESVFDRIGFAVRFMALFSILTGFVVLAAAVVVSRVRRTEETVLLKTLGASRSQTFAIMAVEYTLLGLLAAATGVLLSLAAAWALARFVFETHFVLPALPLAVIVVGVTAVTLVVGLVNSRGIYARPPLDVLRIEV
jgi:putative ABC transport system permease protein